MQIGDTVRIVKQGLWCSGKEGEIVSVIAPGNYFVKVDDGGEPIQTNAQEENLELIRPVRRRARTRYLDK